MDAVILAGSVPSYEDPLYLYTQGQAKAMIDIAGKPMVQWVLDALGGANDVDYVLVIGLNSDCDLTCDKPLHFIPDQGDLLQNAMAGLQYTRARNPNADHVLFTSSDIPTVTSEMIDWRIEQTQKHMQDIHFTVVERQTMETRFPDANRSYVKLKDYELCGGDLHFARPALVEEDEIWGRLIAARKNALKQASLLGFDLLLLLLLGRMTLKDAERRVSERLGVNGQACISPYAELAMDVDKPHQLEIVRQELSKKSIPTT
ncbi:MAG TPA: NTP transferase domain-containing protein [Anaerolineae bacterium]|nr:NTP transferase domain-containing protein [Anaerolineae bacterium]